MFELLKGLPEASAVLKALQDRQGKTERRKKSSSRGRWSRRRWRLVFWGKAELAGLGSGTPVTFLSSLYFTY